jgi:hypothetical protein
MRIITQVPHPQVPGKVDRSVSAWQHHRRQDRGHQGDVPFVLPSPIVDPLLRPGQPPRPLRLLGQDPSKPIHPQGSIRKSQAGPARDEASQSTGTVLGANDGRQGPTPGPSTASRQPRPAPPPGARREVRRRRAGRGLPGPGLSVLYGDRARPGRERDPDGEVRGLRGGWTGLVDVVESPGRAAEYVLRPRPGGSWAATWIP